MIKEKYVKDSFSTMTEMVLPNDTNNLGNLYGGRLMHYMDMVGAIAAQRHCNNIVVTASVDNVSFKRGIPLGSVITLEAKVTRAFNSSMEVMVIVHCEDIPKNIKYLSNTAFITYVAVDHQNKPIRIPALIPDNDEERELYNSALARRDFRLELAKKKI